MFFINSSDNAKIAVYELNPSGVKTIVLVHGWPLSHKMFEYQIPALLNSNYRIITIDLRGFGNSEETSTGYNYNQFATDLYYVIYMLNLWDFDLLGFSMGGAIVTRYMRRYQGYGVKRLCLLDAAVPSYSKSYYNPYGQSLEDTNNLIKLGFNDRPALNEYFGSIFFYKEQSKPFKEWFQGLNNSASGLGEMNSLIALRDEDLFNDLRYINVPTGIFHGKEDKICSFKMAEIMNKNIGNSRLYLFEKAGHGAFYEVKDSVNKDLIQFLKDN
ncbi:MAG: alpha/beta hydrolase [Clostridia bacterium]|nr:alpha/beta hydrolase [Clostridia bacterium]